MANTNIEAVLFQSQNGLILTSGLVDTYTITYSFQSQNGLILTILTTAKVGRQLKFQSQNGLILTPINQCIEI